MANNLIFNESYTVEQFKAKELVSKIEVKRNPNTGKLFFQYGAKVGAVALAGIPTKPMISKVETSEGESFYLLHEEGNGGAPVVATL